jgi:NAD(P)-dependent dehydrogenase (short-subunit alcohol dehydrogenase family)
MALNPPVHDWRSTSVWLVGASTGIGRATASALHQRGARVFVSARSAAPLDAFVVQHPGAVAVPLDVTDRAAVAAAAQSILARGPLHHVVYCAGHYQELRATEFNLDEMLRHEDVNYTGALRVLDAVLPAMLAHASASGPAHNRNGAGATGHISLVSSVAGFRGLPKSLAYGPTKAALINLAETLYLDLQPSGIAVSVINPGFVETPLTAQNRFKMPALLTPGQAAQEIIAGWERGEFDIHFPKRFTRWMKLLRLLPYRLYFPAVRRFTGL